jgi:hypothetical protein
MDFKANDCPHERGFVLLPSHRDKVTILSRPRATIMAQRQANAHTETVTIYCEECAAIVATVTPDPTARPGGG